MITRPLHKPAAADNRARYTAPMRLLDHDPMRTAANLLEAAERGDHPRLQWLYRAMERRWALLGAAISRRLAAIVRLPVRVLPAEDTPEAAAAAARLSAFYDAQDNIDRVVSHLAMATFRGFSHVEIVPDIDGLPAQLQPVPHQHFAREGLDGPWLYLPDPQSRDNAVPLDPAQWITRECERPVDEVALVAFIRYQLGRKDWDAWVETYGIPPLIIELPPDVPADQIADYQAMAEAVIGDLRGTIPSGAKAVNIGTDTRQSQPFADFIAALEREVTLAATGGLLTMLNEATGLGSGQSQSHQDAFDDLAAAEAREITALLHRSIDRQILGAEIARAAVSIEMEDEDNLDALATRVAALAGAGLRADAAELSERFGITLRELPTPNIQLPTSNPGESAAANPLDALIAGIAADLGSGGKIGIA